MTIDNSQSTTSQELVPPAQSVRFQQPYLCPIIADGLHALQNGASIATMILITESLVTDIPEKEKMPSMPPAPEY